MLRIVKKTASAQTSQRAIPIAAER
jgi:hypothetical protein